ncbi:MAG: response regulator, partial [Elusimicrobia bacterium]|nr:response regulator [Elusimicrobiota bacterium]
MTAPPLRILHLEDDDGDAELVRRKLKAEGLDCELRRARSEAEFSAALAEGGYDLVISDFAIPGYGGMEALRLSKETQPGVPFIFVSGTIGEDAAVETLLNGATDYILKTSSMKRLVPALRRALTEASERSERRSLEERYRQAQRMESIGRLAGGVAHDFNNLLTAILGFSGFVSESLEPADPRREDLAEVRKAAERAMSLTRQLLAFSRRQVLEPRVLDLNEVVADIERLLRRVIGADVALETRLAPGLWNVVADRGQMEQVLMNLAVNARDAMPGGGRIVIGTENVELDAAFAAGHPSVTPGPHARVWLSDDGTGMDAATRARIFEPFFTTKGPEKGTGLGLATVYGIVKQSGGSIWVESEPGSGTRFDVYLPRAEGA